MTRDAGNYYKCPKCGSRHYERSATRDITYTHQPHKPTRVKIENPSMPWFFKCLECGYEEDTY